MSFGDADEEAEDAAIGAHYESSVNAQHCICGKAWICENWYMGVAVVEDLDAHTADLGLQED